MWWRDQALVSLLLRPADQVFKLKCPCLDAQVARQLLELPACLAQLQGQLVSEARVVADAGLQQQPRLDRRWRRQALPSAWLVLLRLLHLLQGAQRVGQQPQMVPLQRWQQRALEPHDLGFAQRAQWPWGFSSQGPNRVVWAPA